MSDEEEWPEDEAELPPYLRRYVLTRSGGRLTTWGLDGETSIIPFALEHRREAGLRYLADTVERVRFGGLTTNALFAALGRLHDSSHPSFLIGEVVDRLDHLTSREGGRLVRTLMALHEADVAPGGRVWVDRAIHRLLPRFSAKGSPKLALCCFRSSRAYRHRAAAKYYRAFGLDDAARQLILSQVADGSVQDPALVSTDAALVEGVGLAEVLSLAPSTYYRKRAIELAMGTLPADEIRTICRDYPQELVWAVYDQRRADYLDALLAMLDQYADDAYLLNRIVGCIGRVGSQADVARALSMAYRLLRELPGTQAE